MKIRKFNESIESIELIGVEKISNIEFRKYIKSSIDIPIEAVITVHNNIHPMTYEVDRYFVTIKSNKWLFIAALDDEWFLVHDDISYWKCDQLDGLTNLLKSIDGLKKTDRKK